jgi:hypothetical protein
MRELLLVWAILVAIVCGAIARKAGYSRWYGLLMVVPLVNIVLIWIFAYAKWPALDRTER